MKTRKGEERKRTIDCSSHFGKKQSKAREGESCRQRGKIGHRDQAQSHHSNAFSSIIIGYCVSTFELIIQSLI